MPAVSFIHVYLYQHATLRNEISELIIVIVIMGCARGVQSTYKYDGDRVLLEVIRFALVSEEQALYNVHTH